MSADRGCSRGPCFRALLDRKSPPPIACWLELWVPLALRAERSFVGSSLPRNRVLCFWWASEQDGRDRRGRFRDMTQRLWSMFAHRCIAVCSVVGCCTWYMLVCGCPASQGGIQRARSPAGRRVRASAPVYGRKNDNVYKHFCAYMCTFYFFAFSTLVGTLPQLFQQRETQSQSAKAMTTVTEKAMTSESDGYEARGLIRHEPRTYCGGGESASGWRKSVRLATSMWTVCACRRSAPTNGSGRRR